MQEQRLRSCVPSTWSDCVMEVIRASEADGDITQDITQFISKLCDHLDARFPVDGLKEWSAFDIEVLCTDVSFDYGTTDIAMLAQKYETILHPESMDDIKHEYADFKYIVKQKHKQGSIQTFSDMVAATLRCEELKEVSQLVDICDTFQASSADCERGFSLMNRIKTKSRNRLEVTHLDQLKMVLLSVWTKSTTTGEVRRTGGKNKVIFYSLSSDYICSYCLTH